MNQWIIQWWNLRFRKRRKYGDQVETEGVCQDAYGSQYMVKEREAKGSWMVEKGIEKDGSWKRIDEAVLKEIGNRL